MTPEEMAALMARAYRDQAPWSAADIAGILSLRTTRTLIAPSGFLLATMVADEAEILALATDPDARRQGVGSDLLARFHEDAADAGAVTAFLEVSEENAPARVFYAARGYRQTGRRRDYYRVPGGGRADALLMARALTQSHP